jgi:hypothetical protein
MKVLVVMHFCFTDCLELDSSGFFVEEAGFVFGGEGGKIGGGDGEVSVEGDWGVGFGPFEFGDGVDFGFDVVPVCRGGRGVLPFLVFGFVGAGWRLEVLGTCGGGVGVDS